MNGWTLILLRWSYVAFIVFASGQTAFAAHSAHGPHGWPIAILALVEIAAALALLITPLERAACMVLLGVYAIATVLTIAEGEAPLRFFYYAATALALVWGRATPHLAEARALS